MKFKMKHQTWIPTDEYMDYAYEAERTIYIFRKVRAQMSMNALEDFAKGGFKDEKGSVDGRSRWKILEKARSISRWTRIIT